VLTVVYNYWIVRFVPNVARGEFSNIGLVAGSDGHDWAVAFDPRFIRNHGNLSSDLRELRAWTEWFRRTVSTDSESEIERPAISAGWMEHLRARQANSVQLSPAVQIEAESARAAVDVLYPHLVEREVARRRTTLTRRQLRSEVRETLVHELGFTVGTNLFPSPRARIGRQRGAFDFAYDGDTRFSGPGRRLTNVWAFNVMTLDALQTEIQSWNYLVSRLRAEGATIESHGTGFEVSRSTAVEVVIDAPNTTRGDSVWRNDIFEAATEAWALNDVRVNTLDGFLERAREANLNTVG
jgi:hypothetical protein